MFSTRQSQLKIVDNRVRLIQEGMYCRSLASHPVVRTKAQYKLTFGHPPSLPSPPRLSFSHLPSFLL